MLGKPKYRVDDKVRFKMDDMYIYGKIYIVDDWGTFFDNSDVSYDILVDPTEEEPYGVLYKHISESSVEDVT